MNAGKLLRFVATIGFLGLSLGQSLQGATYSWIGGAGTWSTSSTNWNAGGPLLWDSGNGSTNIADFYLGGDTPVVSGPIFVNGIQFDNTASISGSTINLVTGTLATPRITVNTTGGTIGSILAGTAGLAKFGTGALVLTGANNYSGGTTISSGTLQIGNGGSTGSLGTGSIINNASLVYNFNASTTLALPNSTYSGTGNLSATSGNINFTGNLAVGGAFNYNAIGTGGGGSTASSTVTASSASLAGGIYYNGGPNTQQLTISTSAANGPIALSGITSGKAGVQYGFNGLDFNAGSGSISITGANVFNWWSNGAIVEFDGQVSGGGSMSGTAQSGSSASLIFNNPGASTYSGAISGGFVLFKQGAGLQALTGANSYSGSTSIMSGTLQVADGSLPSASAIAFSNGTTLNDARTNAHIAEVVTGSGTWNLTGYGQGSSVSSALNLSGFTGTMNLLPGARFWNNQGTNQYPAASATINISSGAEIGLASAGTCSATVNIAGTGQDGLGALRFEGGTLAGTLNLTAAATLQADASSNTISGPVNTNTFTLTLNPSAANMSFTGNIAGSGSLTKIGGSSVFLSGSNSYSGLTSISAGSLNISGAMGSGGYTMTGGVVNFSGSQTITGANSVLIGYNSGVGTFNVTNGNLINNGTVTSFIGQNGGTGVLNVSGGAYTDNDNNILYIGNVTSGTLTVSGSGLMTENNPAQAIYLARTSTSNTGAIALNGGTLATGRSITHDPGQTTGSSFVNFNGGTLLATTGNSNWISGLTAINVQNGGAIINTNGFNMGIGQALLASGSGGLTLLGGGQLTLNGSSTYTGGTNINAGTLVYGNANALLSTGAVNVSGSSSVLELGGFSSSAGAVTLTAGTIQHGTLSGTSYAVQNGLVSANLGGSGATLIQSGGGLVTLSGNNTYSGATSVSAGTLALSNASGNNIASTPSITLAGSTSWLDVTALNASTITLGASQTLAGFGKVNGGVATGGPLSTLTPGSLTAIGTLNTGTLNLTAGASLNFVLGTAGTSALSPGLGSLINVTGNLTLPSTQIASLNIINNSTANGQGSFGNGFYDLFNYTGTLTGSPSAAFGLGSGVKTYSYAVIAGSPNELILQVSVPTLNWTGLSGGTGASDSVWNVTSTNWSNGTSNSAQSYLEGAIVSFGDTNAVSGGSISNSTVVISGSGVSPASVIFSNSAVNYTIGGSAGIAGPTGISMNGTGIVNLQNGNSFTGPVAINSGAINISNNAALGNSIGATVANGAALQIQGGITANPVSLNLNGAGLTSNPAGALSNVNGNNTYSGAISLGTAATIAASSGTLTLTGGVATAGNLLTFGGSGTTNIASQPISGSSGVLIASPATLILSTSNNYSGATTVNSGATLQLAAAGAIPTGASAGNLTVNGTLDTNSLSTTVNGLSGTGSVTSVAGGTPTLSVGNNGASSTFGGVISDGGGTMTLAKIGSGIFTVTGPNNYSGVTSISGGALQIGSGGTTGGLNLTANINISNSAALAFNRSDNYGGAYSGTISGTGTLAVLGGLLSLSGSDTYTGVTTIGGGTLQIGAGGATGSIGNTSSISVASGAMIAFNRTDNYGGNFTRLISGSGGLTLSAGSLTLTAASTFSGPTNISVGTLNATSSPSATLPSQTAINIASGATLIDARSAAQIANVITGSGTWNLSGIDRQWYSTNSPNTEDFSRFTGTLNLPSGARFWNGQGTNQFPGAGATINIASGGQLSLANSGTCSANVNIAGTGWSSDGGNQLGALRFYNATLAGNVTLTAAARIEADGPSSTGGTLSGGVNTNGNTLSLYPQSANLYLMGCITGSGGVTDIGGAGTVYLAGNNSGFTGLLTLGGGNLQLASSGALAGGGNVTFAGGMLQFSASNTLDYSAQIKNSTSAMSLNTNGQTVTLAGGLDNSNTGGLTKLGTGTLVMQGSNTYGGSTTLSAGTLVMQGNNIYNGNTNLNAGMLVIAANSIVNTGNDGLIDSGPIGTGALNIASGTLSDDGNARTIANPVAITAGMTFASTGTGSLTFDPTGLAAPSIMTISNGVVLTVDNNTTIKESISSSGSYIAQAGTGMLTLASTGNSVLSRIDVNGGTLAVSSGSISLGSYFTLNTGGTAATYIQTGGTVMTGNNTGAYVNNSSGATSSTFTLSGGVFTIRGTSDGLYVGHSNSGTASISGGGVLTTPWTHVGASTGTAVLNLGDGASFSGGTNIHNGGTSGILVTGYVSYAGASATISFNGGTLKASGPQTSFMTGLTNAYVADAGGIIDNGGFNITIAQALQHGGVSATDGGLVFQGAGATIVSGANSFNGGTVVSGGTLQLGNASALGATTGSLTLNSATLDLHGNSPTVGDLFGGSSGVITNATGFSTFAAGTSNSTTFAGAILQGGGTINVVKNGAGVLTFLGNNTYTGLTTINGGTLALGNGGTSGEVLGGITLNNDSTLVFNRSNDVDFTSTINGAGFVTKNGGGTLTLEGFNGYSDGTRLLSGRLLITNGSALGSGGLTANGGTLDLSGNSPTVGALTGAAGTITNGNSGSPATITVGQSIATTFNGRIVDGLGQTGLTLSSGTLTLAGSNAYSGATTINGGSLIAGGANLLSASSAVTLSGGLLDATAGSQSIAAFNGDGGSTLSLSIGNLLKSLGSVNFGGVLNITGAAGSFNELIAYPNVTYNGGDGTFSTVNLNGVPLSGYTLAYHAHELDLMLATGPATWNLTGGGSWATGGNWNSGSSPSGQGVTAVLGSSALAPATVTLDGAQTLGQLIFNNANGYTLTTGSAGSLTMDNTSGVGDAQIVVLSGSHSIAAALTLAGTNTSIALNNGGSLGISGNILDGQSGNAALTLSSSDGTGLLALSGTNFFGGGMTVNSGELVLNGAASLLAGSSLTIGSGAGPGAVFNPPATSLAVSPNLAPVPEPGTMTLLLVLVVAIGVGVWRRKAEKIYVQCSMNSCPGIVH